MYLYRTSSRSYLQKKIAATKKIFLNAGVFFKTLQRVSLFCRNILIFSILKLISLLFVNFGQANFWTNVCPLDKSPHNYFLHLLKKLFLIKVNKFILIKNQSQKATYKLESSLADFCLISRKSHSGKERLTNKVLKNTLIKWNQLDIA